MIILAQNKKTIVNLDNIADIFVTGPVGGVIWAGDTIMGKYSDADRAVQIMEEIMDAYDRGNPYRMPEK